MDFHKDRVEIEKPLQGNGNWVAKRRDTRDKTRGRSHQSIIITVIGLLPFHNTIYLLKAYIIASQPHRVTSGLFDKFKSRTSCIQYKTCTLHTYKTYKHYLKVSPLVSCKKWQIKSGDTGTIGCVGLAFKYHWVFLWTK